MIEVPYLVKKALKKGMLRKNYRINVLDDNGEIIDTIDNNDIEWNSVRIDERMCSGSTLKFGLCEGSSIEFSYAGHDNIRGRKIQVFIDVECPGLPTYQKVADMEEFVPAAITQMGTYRLFSNTPEAWERTIVREGFTPTYYTPTTEGDTTYQVLELGINKEIEVDWGDIDPATHPVELQMKVSDDSWYPIPMGYFDITQCSTQFATGIIKAVGYNRLMSTYLDARGNAILDDVFVSDQEMTVFDIVYTLLQEMTIFPDFDKLSPNHEEHEGEMPTIEPTREVTKLFNFKFYQNYEINAPLNYYEWHVHQGATGNPSSAYFRSRIFMYYDSSQYMLPVFERGDLEQFERDMYQRFVDEYGRAWLLDANNVAISGERIMETMLQSQLWVSMFGIAVGVIANDTGDISEGNVYSTLQYEYNVAHNLPTKNVELPGEGIVENSCNICPLKEAGSRTFYNKTIRFLIPTVFGLLNSNQSKLLTFDIDGYNHPLLMSNQYTYYENAQMSTTKVGEVEPFYYPDGTRLDDRTETSTQDVLVAYGIPTSDLPSAYKVQMSTADAPDFTLREVQSAVFETVCQFGKLDRVTDLFAGVELNSGGLYPRNNLYPDNALYPSDGYPSNNLHPFPSEYSKLWTDTVGAQSFKYLIITYKTTTTDSEGNIVEIERTLQRTVNSNGTTNYNMSDNWLFKNFVWTYEEVAAYAEAMVPKMRAITWFPFEMWAAGLPYVETGDLIEITDRQGDTYTSYILQRQLSGIHNLQDTYINGELNVY